MLQQSCNDVLIHLSHTITSKHRPHPQLDHQDQAYLSPDPFPIVPTHDIPLLCPRVSTNLHSLHTMENSTMLLSFHSRSHPISLTLCNSTNLKPSISILIIAIKTVKNIDTRMTTLNFSWYHLKITRSEIHDCLRNISISGSSARSRTSPTSVPDSISSPCSFDFDFPNLPLTNQFVKSLLDAWSIFLGIMFQFTLKFQIFTSGINLRNHIGN